MQCDLNDIPDLGLLGIVMHRVMNRAKSKYQEFDLSGRGISRENRMKPISGSCGLP